MGTRAPDPLGLRVPLISATLLRMRHCSLFLSQLGVDGGEQLQTPPPGQPHQPTTIYFWCHY